MDLRSLHREIAAGWNAIAAAKYRAELEDHVELLRRGGHNLLPAEYWLLQDSLRECGRVIHLQCSHGLDALGLLNLGVREVVGIDISEEMIRQAEEKTRRLGANATWHCCDVFDAPTDLRGTAHLVYTGRGAMPWIMDLSRWATIVAELLRPGGRVFLFEGHPLDAAWDRSATRYQMRPDYPGYFVDRPLEQPGFPASVLEGEVSGSDRPTLWERPWRPGQVIDALLTAGLRLEHFDEYPVTYWQQFPNNPEELLGRLPHSYAVIAIRDTGDS